MSRVKKRRIDAVDEDPTITLPKKKKQKVAKDEEVENDPGLGDWILLAGTNITIPVLRFVETKSKEPLKIISAVDRKNKEFLSEAGKQLTRFTEEKTRFTFTIKKSEILFFEDKNSYGTFTTYSMIFYSPNNEVVLVREFVLHNSGKFYEEYNRNLKYPLNCTLLEDLFRASGKEIFESTSNSELWKLDVKPGPEVKNKRSFQIDFLVNPKAIERSIQEGKPFEHEEIMIKYLEPDVRAFLERENKKFLEITSSIHPFIPAKVEEPQGLKDGFKFHRYQIDAINWMNAIEKDSDKELKYCDLVPWKQSNNGLMMDLHSNKFVLASKMEEYYGGIKSKGGVLADAVGLGKTLELIGLSLLTLGKAREKLPDYNEKGLINTRATLVVCPNHLAKQWADEIIKYTQLSVVIYATLDDFNNTTYLDFIGAGFVIVTSAMFKNKNYFALGCGNKKIAVNRPMISKRSRLVQEHLEQLKNSELKFQTIGPILDNFHWPRIIVDEAHEVFTDPFLGDCLACIPKSYAWYVSATPFPSLELFDAAKRFLEIWDDSTEHEDSLGEEYEIWVENDIIFNNLIWRNVKESVGEEYKVPDYEEDLVYVDFHAIERLLHKEGTPASNLELCSGVIPYNATLDGVAAKNIEDAQHKRAQTLGSISAMKATYETYKANLAAGIQTHVWKIDEYPKRIEASELQVRILDAEIAKWTNLEKVLDGKNISDPTVVNELTLVNIYGSKMARLINWLNDNMEEDEGNRFILFSKFSDYLVKIHRVLHKAGIKAVHLEGNVIQKTKKLAQFKEENVKVLLMSLGNSAAGTNLIEANYVVLVDPMQGSVEEARAYEMQALGRAHRQGQDQNVHLVRFVVRDSVEEELYTRNKSSGRTKNNANRPLLARSNSLASSQQDLHRAGSALSLNNDNNNNNNNNNN
jgi:SNF2 family DNA or RNA helicase